MDLSLNFILSSISVVLALIGLYIVIRVWGKWRQLDIEAIRGRVFLNKKFLERNWIYVFLTGATVTLHQFIGVVQPSIFISNNGMLYAFSETFEFLTLVFLVILAYEWYRVLHLKK